MSNYSTVWRLVSVLLVWSVDSNILWSLAGVREPVYFVLAGLLLCVGRAAWHLSTDYCVSIISDYTINSSAMSRLLGARPLLLLTRPGTQVQLSSLRLVSGASHNNNFDQVKIIQHHNQLSLISTEQLLPTVISVS